MIPPLFKTIRQDVLDFFKLPRTPWGDDIDVVIIVGQNAAGKSFVRRMCRLGCEDHKIRLYDFSQERRCGGGIETAFIYGDENWNSTGVLTLGTFTGAFKQKLDGKTIFIWDEPEIGLSEETQMGVVQFVREKLKKRNRKKHLLGIVFMTHSRTFVSEFLNYPNLAFIDLDRRYKTARGWVNRKPKAADIEEVSSRGIARFRKLSKLLDQK